MFSPPFPNRCLQVVVLPQQRWQDWTGKGGGGTLVTYADIYPGIRPGQFVVPVNVSLEMMFDPSLVDLAIPLFDAGRLDAEYWAVTNGYE